MSSVPAAAPGAAAPGGGAGWGGAKQPPPPSAIDAVLPPVSGDGFPQPSPPSGAFSALLLAIVVQLTVPSLLCYWGALVVLWPGHAPLGPAAPAAPAGAPPASRPPLLLDPWNTGLVWTPILFSASWSVTEPWCDALCTVHGHYRPCALVGGVLLTAGLSLSALGAALGPGSSLLPLLTGLSAGIAAGVGAGLLVGSSALVMLQRWGVRAQLAASTGSFMQGLGLTVAPLVALPLCLHLGPGGALGAAALASLPALLAAAALAAPEKQVKQPRSYEHLTEMAWQINAARRDSGADVEADVRTEISDDGGSLSEHQPDSPRPSPGTTPAAVVAEPPRTTVVAEVHCDGSGARQQPGSSLARANGGPASPGVADNPRPLFDDGGVWNLAYSFDCDGDDDIDLFVRRLSPRRGAATRCCSAAASFCRGFRADLRPAIRPSFYLALLTLVACRLAGLALTVLLPALTLDVLNDGEPLHIAAAVPSIAGLGAMVLWLPLVWDRAATATAGAPDADRPLSLWKSSASTLACLSVSAAMGFLVLGSASKTDHWGWLMMASWGAGYGSTGVLAVQGAASKEILGGATAYRAQPLLSVTSGLLTVLLPLFCDFKLTSCVLILSGMFAVLAVFWMAQLVWRRFFRTSK